MLVAMAPTFLLAGVASGATLVAQFFMRRPWMVWGFFGLALVVLGLNTRLPTFARDLVGTRWAEERLGPQRTVNVSQAVKLRYDGQPISARRAAYDYPAPVCYGDGCFINRGYSTPHLYWVERPEKSVLTSGLTLANASARAPTLAIDSSKSDHLLIVGLTLSDPDGRAISTGRYVYRNGFQAEPPDFSDYVRLDTDRAQTIRLAWNFMLHGNLVNVLLGREDAIWSIDYGSRHPQVLIAKYSAAGQLHYQAMFKPPATIGLYQGGILEKTFHEKDGYVYFEWRNSERPAGRVIIKRNMAVRFLIPGGGRAE